jgi:hypothetical protein
MTIPKVPGYFAGIIHARSAPPWLEEQPLQMRETFAYIMVLLYQTNARNIP